MKATVTYTENGASKQISVEAADMETVKNAVSQWSVTERRLSNRIIEIKTIKTVVSTFGKAFNIE
jgi:hypothetical protein